MQAEELARQQAAAAKTPAGQPPPVLRPPVVLISSIPRQPGEERARQEYAALLQANEEAPLANLARCELAELLTQRDEFEPALRLLKDAIGREPPADLGERIQLRLGYCLQALDSPSEALALFAPLARNDKSPWWADARARAGECCLKQQQWDKAVEWLLPFKDHGPLQNLPGLTDRALLRLGAAYAELRQWDQSRQAYETLFQRFGQSPWNDEARYAHGWAWQNQGQYDQAVNAYTEITKRTASDVAARAQLQIGLCRLTQQRYAEAAQALHALPVTYDVPELAAAALTEAARAHLEPKQFDEAEAALHEVLDKHRDSPWAEIARARLQKVAEQRPPAP